MTERLCKDCISCSPPIGCGMSGDYLCTRPIGASHSRVTGTAVVSLYARCEVERRGHRTLFGRLKCGPDGRFFQPGSRFGKTPRVYK